MVCKVTGRRRTNLENGRLSWANTAHCSDIWPHLIARDSGKCSLTAQEKEKMSWEKEAFPEAHRVCSDPQWHVDLFSVAHPRMRTCTQAQAQAQSQRFPCMDTCLFRQADTHVLRDMPVHGNTLSEGVFLQMHTRAPPSPALTPPLLSWCFLGGRARGTVLHISAHSSLLEQVSKG